VGYDTGLKGLWDVAIADVNGDTFLDIVTAGKNAAGFTTLVVLSGNGTGAFVIGAPVVTALKGKDFVVELANLSGTALPEAVLNNYNNVMVLTNVAGVFTPTAPLISGGKNIRGAQLIDLNHDTFIDIVVANYRTTSVTAWLNNGAGVFTTSGTFATGVAGRNPTSLSVGDFDHDGNWDVAVSNLKKNQISVLLGDGAGTFRLQTEADYSKLKPKLGAWVSIAAGDVDGDGKTDLVVGNAAYNEVDVLLAVGNGTFSTPYRFKVGNVLIKNPAAIALTDFNNDGGLDIAVVSTLGNGGVSILLKNLVI
jgi:hypothetical protein